MTRGKMALVMRAMAAVVASMLSLFGGATVARADEAKTPVSAATILSIMTAPVQSRVSPFDEALKEPPPAAPDPSVGEVLPDGSVRYGRTVITVRNPCPPGTAHYEPPPRPGRPLR